MWKKLDQETLERWVEYLKKPEKEHPFLNKWSQRLAGPDSPEREKLAGEFQDVLLAVAAEKAGHRREELHYAGRQQRTGNHSMMPISCRSSVTAISCGEIFSANEGFSTTAIAQLDRFLSGEWKSHLDSLRAELASLKQALPPKYPFLHAIRDVQKPANIKVQLRGNPETLGDEAPRRFLAILCPDAPAPFTKGSGRLELAEAIANRSNPLTARVMVNRIWQHHFGQGIVRTAEQFRPVGRSSEPPRAARLSGLSLHGGQLVDQSDAPGDPALKHLRSEHRVFELRNYAVEPENRLLWRANRRRLDAEALRDSLLHVSGNLDLTAGGRAVKMTDQFKRRTVYGFVSRKKLDGMLALFDFANPNNTSENRIVTNVPLTKAVLHEQRASLSCRPRASPTRLSATGPHR